MKSVIKKTIGKFNFNKKTIINGKKFLIPIINNIGYKNIITDDGYWMPFLLNLLIKKNSGIFVDVGANIGQTLLQVKSIDEDINYIGIEPNPACVSYMRHLIKLNNFKNVKIVPVGLFSVNKLLNFYLESEVDSGATVMENLRPGFVYDSFIVPVFSFQSLLDIIDINEIGIIKIDVEGSELEILNSLCPFLAKYKPVLICEVLWAHNNEKKENAESRNRNIVSILKDTGYSIFQIIKSEDLNHIIDFKEISEFENNIYTLENRNLCDYVFVHKEKCNMIKSILK